MMKPGATRRGLLRRMMRSVFSRRTAKVLLWSGVVLGSGLVLFYQVERWRGARALEQAKEEYLAAGGRLNIGELAPDPVPDEENFGALAILDGIAIEESPMGKKNLEKLRQVNLNLLFPRFAIPSPQVPLTPEEEETYWSRLANHLKMEGSEGLSEEEVARLLLSKIETAGHGVFEELAAGIERPHAQWLPACYEGWQHVVLCQKGVGDTFALLNLARTLSLRGMAAAELGDRERALESVLISLQIARLLRSGSLVDTLIGYALESGVRPTVKSGMKRNIWTKEDLLRMSHLMEQPEAPTSLRRTMEFETIAFLQFLELVKSGEIQLERDAAVRESAMTQFALRLVPDGWLDLNGAWSLRAMRSCLTMEGGFDNFSKLVELAGELDAERRNGKGVFSLSTYYIRKGYPEWLAVSRRGREAENLRRMGRAATAVEDYRLETGRLPDRLEDLVPDRLSEVPVDLMDGMPIRYRLMEGGGYRLYSVGDDLEDNGGRSERMRKVHSEGFDLVW